MEEENLQGKYFSITDPANVSTVIYQVNKTEKEFAKTGPKYTVERLEFSEEYIGENKKKTFALGAKVFYLSRRIFLRTRLTWRSKSPLSKRSASTLCSKRGTVQAKKPSLSRNRGKRRGGSTIYPTRREGERVREKVLM